MRQHGAVARWQLLAAGITGREVEGRLASGHLHMVHRGVYAVGHRRLSLAGHRAAAVLAYGAQAVLSHRTAAALWNLRPDGRLVIDVTAPTTKRPRPGLRIHHAVLAGTDRAEIDGLPVTAWPRTLIDLAGQLTRRDLLRAIERADQLQILDFGALDEMFTRARGHHGEPALRRALAAYDPRHRHTREELERRTLEMLDRQRLGRPEVNGRVAGFEVDLLWRSERLAVELDGWEFHRTRAAFERDRHRSLVLAAHGFTCVRLTWRQVVENEASTAAGLRARLGGALR